MTDQLSRIIKGLQTYQQQNRPPVIEEPGNAFEGLVNEHADMKDLIAEVKRLLKPVETDERKLRDGLAESLRTFFGDDLKEGVNNYELSNLRKLKLGHKVDRKVDSAMVAPARAAYKECQDKPSVPFDDFLRIKYELDMKSFRKLKGHPEAALAVSRMLETKFAAPTLEVD